MMEIQLVSYDIALAHLNGGLSALASYDQRSAAFHKLVGNNFFIRYACHQFNNNKPVYMVDDAVVGTATSAYYNAVVEVKNEEDAERAEYERLKTKWGY